MISQRRYIFLLFMIVLVYLFGMGATLFENDSAQFAVMAMRMYQEHDFINLFKGPNEYLDKPHMHYWLAGFSYKIFGLNHWAYRLPGILSILLGAYSCFGLGKLLYNVHVGKLAALIFMTAQTIVLAAIDVRTDAVLTGFTIFSIWQLAAYVEKNNLTNIIWGAIGAGVAFSTKGQIALVVIGITLLCHLAYTRKWRALFSYKVLVAFVVFMLTISPMLYAYYQQFDLHPEKIIRGKNGRSGIFFIFWEQSFERMSGEGIGKNSSDYFFFFHTFLWVFLPWTVVALMGIWCRAKTMVKLKWTYNNKYEFLTFGAIAIIFPLISFAQFKLPHYLNILMPLFAVLTASFLYSLYKFKKIKSTRWILGFQYLILIVVFLASILLCFYVFDLSSPIICAILLVLFGLVVYYFLKNEGPYHRVITLSVASSLLLNVVLNLHFYPNLLKYQGGSEMAKLVAQNDIPVNRIYKISERFTWALDFYNQDPVDIISLEGLKNKRDVWVYADQKEMETLVKAGVGWDQQLEVDQFRITRLQGKFLNPNTRDKVLNKMYLLHLP